MNNVKWSSDQQDRKTHQEGDEARTQTDKKRADHPNPTKQTRGRQWSTQNKAVGDEATPPSRNEFQPSKPRLYSYKKGNTRYGRNKIEKSYLKSCQRQHQANVIRISSPRAKLTRGVICSAKNVKFTLLGTNSQSAGGKWGHQVETQAGFDAYLRPCGEGPPLVPASWNLIL